MIKIKEGEYDHKGWRVLLTERPDGWFYQLIPPGQNKEPKGYVSSLKGASQLIKELNRR